MNSRLSVVDEDGDFILSSELDEDGSRDLRQRLRTEDTDRAINLPLWTDLVAKEIVKTLSTLFFQQD